MACHFPLIMRMSRAPLSAAVVQRSTFTALLNLRIAVSSPGVRLPGVFSFDTVRFVIDLASDCQLPMPDLIVPTVFRQVLSPHTKP